MIASREGMMRGPDVVSKATMGAKETDGDFLLDAFSTSNNDPPG